MMSMATTKILPIYECISRVISYAKNPEKTTFSDLKQVLRYAENDEKTIYKNEKTMYVTGINCKAKTAYEEMVIFCRKILQKEFFKIHVMCKMNIIN